MTRSAGRHSGSGRKHAPISERAPLTDGALFIAILMIGAVGVYLGSLVTGGQWKPVLLGYVIAVLFLLNLYGWRAYAGAPLAYWQQALARVPLRFAGFGGRRGKPMVSARRDPHALTVLFVALATSILIVLALTWALGLI